MNEKTILRKNTSLTPKNRDDLLRLQVYYSEKSKYVFVAVEIICKNRTLKGDTKLY